MPSAKTAVKIGAVAPPSVFGRKHESDLIVRLLDEIESHGGVLVVEGEAGIGKSTLLAEANSIAHDHDMLVLSVTGVQSEANLPFASLHQLLRPLLARRGDLPAPQREALESAFGIADAAAPSPSSLP